MLSRLRSLAAALVGRRRFEATMDDEIRFHLEAYTADLIRAGVPRAEAERRARVEFGGVQGVKEECRQSRGLQFADELVQDLRYAGRQLKRSPVFTAAAVVSLALGIGANTAIFSLMDAVLFRNLSLTRPEQLFFLGHGSPPNRSSSANYPLFERYRTSTVLSGVTTYRYNGFTVRTADGLQRVEGQYVSGNYHAVLGVPLVAGRGFSRESDRAVGAPPIAVISAVYWAREFGRSPDVIGKSLNINSRSVTIVGVTAPGFHGLLSGSHVDLTLPMSARALDEPGFFADREGWVAQPIVGRLTPGVSEAQARAELNLIFRRFWLEPENEWARQSPEDALRSATLIPAGKGSSGLRQRYQRPLLVLMGMVGVVLLIACANLANLLLARMSARTREVAVRLSLGAGRRRLLRQFLTESVLLSAMGGVLGLLVAAGCTAAILSVFPTGARSVVLEVGLNGRVLLFTLAVSLLTGIGFGVVPALKATRMDLTPSLKASGNLEARRHRAVGKTLLVGQIALAVLVLSAASLLVRSLRNLKTFDAGFARSNVLLFEVQTGGSGFTRERRIAFYPALVERLGRLPGVVAASLSDRSPIDFSSQLRRIDIPGFTMPDALKGVSTVVVTPKYFQAFDVELVRGRLLSEQDRGGSPRVAVVNESTVRDYFPGVDPLGRRIVLGGRGDTTTIVGIVRDVRHEELREAAPRSVYTALAQPSESFDGDASMPEELTAALRTEGDPRELMRALPAYVREVDRDAMVIYLRTMDQQLNTALVSERLLAALASGFGLLALLLAGVGLYGVMSYQVARRSKEIGIRMALGATRGEVLRRVMGDAALLAATGTVLGLAAAFLATKAVAAFLFQLSPSDPVSLGIVALLLAATAVLAGLLPARRAARVDPMSALRAE